MGICTKRYALLAVCLLQIIFTIERQIFDFLGYLWIPILLNLFDLIFIIFGFFGAFQLRFKYIFSYCSWNTLWLIWNIFLICLYLNIGVLNHQKNIVLKIDPDSSSWWEGNGPGCKKIYNTNSSIPKLENITGCVLNYVHVEVIQSSLQGFLTIVGTLLSIMLWRQFHRNPNFRQSKKILKPISLYSIEFSKNDNSRVNDSDSVEYCETTAAAVDDRFSIPTSPKPMTPRRVKRRSGMARSSTSSFTNYASLKTDSQNSVRYAVKDDDSDRNETVKMTVAAASASAAASSSSLNRQPYQYNPSSSLSIPAQKSIDSTAALRYNSNYRSSHRNKKAKIPLTNSLHVIAPITNNTNVTYNPSVHLRNGHTNLMYQQSSVQSLNENESLEDLYTATNNRPASLRSSYSNFHGTRILSYSTQTKSEKKTDSRPMLNFNDHQQTQRQQNSYSRTLERGENDRASVFFPRISNTSISNFNSTTISNSETNI